MANLPPFDIRFPEVAVTSRSKNTTEKTPFNIGEGHCRVPMAQRGTRPRIFKVLYFLTRSFRISAHLGLYCMIRVLKFHAGGKPWDSQGLQAGWVILAWLAVSGCS